MSAVGNDDSAAIIPDAVRQERMERLREAARSRGFAALLIFSYGARSGMGTHGHLRYLLDWTSWGACTLLLLPVHGAPVVAVPGPFDVPWMRELCPWIAEVHLEAPSNQGRLARALLAEHGVRGRVGLLGGGALVHGVYDALVAPDERWTFEAADDLLDRQRVVKDAFGLRRLRRAAAICDVMFEALAEHLRRPGTPAWQAQAAMNAAGLAEGAETAWNWLTAGPAPDRTRGRREENLAPLRVGDSVVAAIIMTYAGYYGHALRMFSIGDPSPGQLSLWRAVSEAQAAAAALLRPGGNARLLAPAAEAVMFRHFPAAQEGDRLRFQVGHFIGLDYAEYPTALVGSPPSYDRYFPATASPATDFALDAGMTIEIHPNVRPPGLGLGAVGDVFLVTPGGGERLTTFPITLTAVAPR